MGDVRSDPTIEQRKKCSMDVFQYVAPRSDSRSRRTWGAPRDPSLERLSMANSSGHKQDRVSARSCSWQGLALCVCLRHGRSQWTETFHPGSSTARGVLQHAAGERAGVHQHPPGLAWKGHLITLTLRKQTALEEQTGKGKVHGPLMNGK